MIHKENLKKKQRKNLLIWIIRITHSCTYKIKKEPSLFVFVFTTVDIGLAID